MFFFGAYKILNPINANEKSPCNFASHSSQSTSLYDVMKNDDDMALSVVKEQLTLGPKKSMKKNAKSIGWWKIHEAYFSYVGFVA
jgi:hypothetical protein